MKFLSCSTAWHDILAPTMERPKKPISITIFGATGDLSERKLIPALFSLYCQNLLPKQFRLVGFSRGELSDEEFQKFVTNSLRKKGHFVYEKEVEQFVKNALYVEGRFEDADSYQKLYAKLKELDNTVYKTCSNKMFHLAVPPVFYENIFPLLKKSGLTDDCGQKKDIQHDWTRVIVEKPFGRDIQTAQNLDMLLGKLFKESQIFRIDHYLGKETLRNILAFRFSNTLFEPIWNKDHIEKVEIRLHERLGIEGRGALYDNIGAMRDVGQNHVLQMLAAVAMENPCGVTGSNIREERAKIISELKPFGPAAIKKDVIRGQYKGYRKEKDVDPKSQTETYFRMTTYIDNERWRGVPFHLSSGKKMRERNADITIHFKPTRSCLFLPEDNGQHLCNILRFRIQPKEAISLRFWAKKPGFQNKVIQKKLTFRYRESQDFSKIPDAYAILLYDCIIGDQTMFMSTREIEASWNYVTPILDQWQKVPLQIYAQHTDGPGKQITNKQMPNNK